MMQNPDDTMGHKSDEEEYVSPHHTQKQRRRGGRNDSRDREGRKRPQNEVNDTYADYDSNDDNVSETREEYDSEDEGPATRNVGLKNYRSNNDAVAPNSTKNQPGQGKKAINKFFKGMSKINKFF